MGVLALVLVGVLIYYYWCDWCENRDNNNNDDDGSRNNQNQNVTMDYTEYMKNSNTNTYPSKPVQPSHSGTVEDVDAATLAKYMKTYPEMVVAFVSNGCGHCTNMKPAIHAAAKQSKVPIFTCHAHRDGVMDVLKQWQIMGFPTVLRLVNGQKGEEYNGNRQADDLAGFCNKNQ